MTVCLTSAASGQHVQLLDIAEPSFAEYAEKHGFDLHVERGFDCGRPASWYKLILIPRLLEQYDTVVWVDADAHFVRFEPNILDVALRTKPLWMCEHSMEGYDEPWPNCGVLVCHKDKRLTQFFDVVWAQTFYIDHPWWEQAAIMKLLGYQLDGLACLPGGRTSWTHLAGFFGTEWNSMHHDPHPAPVICHHSGLPIQTRLEAMRAGV